MYKYLVTAKHIVEGVHCTGQSLSARVNVLGPLTPFPLAHVVTPELIAKEHIGPGEDVFVAGLFRRHTGTQRNIPIIRVGISSLCRPSKDPLPALGSEQQTSVLGIEEFADHLEFDQATKWLGRTAAPIPATGRDRLW